MQNNGNGNVGNGTNGNAIVPIVPDPNGLANIRRYVDQQELIALVSGAIDQRVGAGIPFTAYDITLTLRAQNPGLEIIHDEVREEVVQYAAIVGCDVELADFNGNMARLYTPPQLKQIQATVVQPAALPAPAAVVSSADDDGGDGGTLLLPGIKSV